jgi:hypothetical protein
MRCWFLQVTRRDQQLHSNALSNQAYCGDKHERELYAHFVPTRACSVWKLPWVGHAVFFFWGLCPYRLNSGYCSAVLCCVHKLLCSALLCAQNAWRKALRSLSQCKLKECSFKEESFKPQAHTHACMHTVSFAGGHYVLRPQLPCSSRYAPSIALFWHRRCHRNQAHLHVAMKSCICPFL